LQWNKELGTPFSKTEESVEDKICMTETPLRAKTLRLKNLKKEVVLHFVKRFIQNQVEDDHVHFGFVSVV
jgi:hypothetical protein